MRFHGDKHVPDVFGGFPYDESSGLSYLPFMAGVLFPRLCCVGLEERENVQELAKTSGRILVRVVIVFDMVY